MPTPVIPTKTTLGQEELRRRTGGLGQRHRTILFLIDGRRPLSEVLSLAQKAGAATSHFEDLVRLGYVELPPEEPAEPVEPDAAIADVAELTHVELTVAGDAHEQSVPPPVAEAMLLVAPPASPAAPLPMADEPAIELAPSAPAPEPVPAPPAPRRSPVAQAVAAFVTEEQGPFETARQCLLDTLRLDFTPFSFRATPRAREASTTAQLIDLIWEIERDLSHSRRSRAGLLALQRARELLGLGNTLVDEESQPGRLDEDA